MNRGITVLFIIALIFVYIEKPFSNQHPQTTTSTVVTTTQYNIELKKQAQLDFLKEIQGHATIVGQTISSNPSMDELNQIQSISGKLPGFIQLSYTPNSYRDMIKANFNNEIAINHSKKNGFVMVYWQPGNPSTGGNANDKNINVSDLFVPSKANTEITKRLESMAEGLQQLQDNNVVVFFRPYAELNTGSFWWACNSQFKDMWLQTYNYLNNTRKLKNIVWVFGLDSSPYACKNYSVYYPGDKYVDMIATDIYDWGTNRPLTTLTGYNEMLAYNKNLGFAEVSPYYSTAYTSTNYPNYDITNHLNILKSNYPQISYYIAFNGYWSLDHTVNLITFMNDPHIITLDEMPRT